MDEPFASVDVLLARRLREESRLLLKESGATTLLVTHDPEDALALADRIAVIVSGRIVQVGTPAELWEAPGHPFIAEVFAGRQLLDADWDGVVATTAFGPVEDLAPPPGAPTTRGPRRWSFGAMLRLGQARLPSPSARRSWRGPAGASVRP